MGPQGHRISCVETSCRPLILPTLPLTTSRYTYISGFSPAELQEQVARLAQLTTAALAASATAGKRACANYRRHLRRQTARVEARLQQLRENDPAGSGDATGVVDPVGETEPPPMWISWRLANGLAASGDRGVAGERCCRACGVPQSAHGGPLGSCWGLWKAHALRGEDEAQAGYPQGEGDQGTAPSSATARAAHVAARQQAAETRAAEVWAEKEARRARSASRHAEYATARAAKEELKAAKAARHARRKAARMRVLEARMFQATAA